MTAVRQWPHRIPETSTVGLLNGGTAELANEPMLCFPLEQGLDALHPRLKAPIKVLLDDARTIKGPHEKPGGQRRGSSPVDKKAGAVSLRPRPHLQGFEARTVACGQEKVPVFDAGTTASHDVTQV